MKKNAFQIIDASGHKHEIPADSLRELKDVPAEQIIDMLCSGEMWFKVTELYKSRGETEYALRSSFRLRGGRPIPPNKLGDYQVTAPASTRFNARLPKLIEIDPADVRCEHDDVRVDFLGSSFQIYTPSGKVYIVPKSEVSVLDRFSSKELERLLKDRFYILTVKATYDGTEIKYTINARFSPPSAPGGISSRASFRSARMAGRSASYASMAAESKEEPASSSVTARSTYARHPKVFLTSSEWDGLIEELRVGEAKFQVAQDEYIKVSSRAAGEFYIQVADLKWMQVTREQGLSHIDFEIASLIPFAGKPVLSISKAALARLAARKAAAEARTTLTSVAARAAESRIHLYDGMKAKVDKALDMAKDFLGKGYIDKGKGRFISLDGKRQVRMGDADILGHHAGGRHMNFEKLGADPITKRVRVEENIHVFLEE